MWHRIRSLVASQITIHRPSSASGLGPQPNAGFLQLGNRLDNMHSAACNVLKPEPRASISSKSRCMPRLREG